MPGHARVACFTAGFDQTDDNPYLNYAIPDDDAKPDAADIAALITAFAHRNRRPRLEYIPASAPLVEPALVQAGFAAEARLPIMVCRSCHPIAPPITEIAVSLVSHDEDLAEAAEVQARAFNNRATDPDRLLRLIAAGGLLVVARVQDIGRIMGVGAARPLHDGVTEIAGIGVLPAYRRRGVAAALTTRLARECILRGADIVWLTPGGRDAERLYARAGFVCASEQLHISKPFA